MCCFSPVRLPWWALSRLLPAPPLRVFDTQIFARSLSGGMQGLVYSMKLSTRSEVAMILPLPVTPGCGEDGLHFVDLLAYSEFFSDMANGFVMPMPLAARAGGPKSMSFSLPTLKVHRVGSFSASFVPTLADFSRLDARFRIPDQVWQRLPAYSDYGFAVFKLEKGGRKRIHPMAFRFPTRDPGRLFFPTVHIHDGKVHETARFNHVLYYQDEYQGQDGAADVVSSSWAPASSFMKIDKAQGLVQGNLRIRRQPLEGKLPNRDTWIPLR